MRDVTPQSNFEWGDMGAAFGLLSRLPITIDHDQAMDRAPQATWAYPLVGAALGAIAALGAEVLLALGASTGIAAAGALALFAGLTGAMHEDGLADCADGLGGGHDVAHRLAIMKDSRIGAFGAVALGIALIARWSALQGLSDGAHLFWPLVAVGAASRVPMVFAMFFVEPARKDGLSAGVGLPPAQSLVAALLIALVLSVFTFGWGGFVFLFWGLVAPIPLFYLAQRLIGGQTGDILGGSQQLAEIATLSAALSLTT